MSHPPQTASAPSRKELHRVAFSGWLGTTVEFYDFLLYGTMAALVFNKLFFPELDPLAGTAASFATFAAGYVARPLGGAIFGHFGDRLGRKSMLVTTMMIMGVASTLIGLLPTYQSVGIWAPLMLVALRIVQGIAAGGEWGGSVLMIAEHTNGQRRGFWASFTQIGAPCGNLLATGVTVIVSALLTPEQFLGYGWRIPFLLSAVLLAIGFFVRLGVSESPAFAQAKRTDAVSRLPLIDVLRSPRPLILAISTGIGPLALQALMGPFLVSYAVNKGYERQSVLISLSIAAAVSILLTPAVAAVSDRLGRRPVMTAGALATVACAFPLYALVDSGSPMLLVAAMLLGLGLLVPLMYGPLAARLTEMFGTTMRYSGAGLGYQLASLIGAGFAPLIASSLLARTDGNSLPVPLLIIAAGLITAAALRLSPETARTGLDQGATQAATEDPHDRTLAR